MPSQTLRRQLPTGSGSDTPKGRLATPHVPPMHVATAQGPATGGQLAVLNMHATGHGKQMPPQSTLVSVPFWIPSRHDDG